MTLEQAKTAKLAKGFALEPVLPGALESTGPLPEKRERKKADIFGILPAGRPAVPRPAPRCCASFRFFSELKFTNGRVRGSAEAQGGKAQRK